MADLLIVPERWRPATRRGERGTSVPTELWPLVLVSAGLPVLYVLGLSGFAWSLPGVVFGARLLRRWDLRMPRGSGLLIALLVWIVLSGLQIQGGTSLIVFGYRSSLILSAVTTFIWLCTTSTRVVSNEAVIRVLAWTWPVLVAFGYAALALPRLDVASLFQRVAPGSIASEGFFVDLTSIRLAELQGFLGYPVPRPAAPFPYANGWGSALALTTPFFVLDRIVGQSAARRRNGVILLAVGIIPAVVSLNRGLWISTAVAVAYVALRRGAQGDWRAAVALVGTITVVVTVVALSPLGNLVTDRVEGAGDSNDSRSSVAVAAVEGAAESPLLGHGAPAEPLNEGPPVGTHGFLWYLMFCHGFVGAALFLGWLGGVVRRGLSLSTPSGIWLSAVPLVAMLQLPIYGLLPQIVIVGAAGALVWRACYPELAAGPAPAAASDHAP